jgi:cation transporter-like permease
MSLISLIVVLIIAGVVVYLVNNLIPMDPKFKMVVNAIIAIALLLWVLQEFGLLGGRTIRLR